MSRHASPKDPQPMGRRAAKTWSPLARFQGWTGYDDQIQ